MRSSNSEAIGHQANAQYSYRRSQTTHIAKKTKAFVESLNGALRLFYLPPYSPDRNPDELVWKHLKADTVGRMTVTSKDDFKSKVRSSMRQLQNNPAKIRSFYKNHSPICRVNVEILRRCREMIKSIRPGDSSRLRSDLSRRHDR